MKTMFGLRYAAAKAGAACPYARSRAASEAMRRSSDRQRKDGIMSFSPGLKLVSFLSENTLVAPTSVPPLLKKCNPESATQDTFRSAQRRLRNFTLLDTEPMVQPLNSHPLVRTADFDELRSTL